MKNTTQVEPGRSESIRELVARVDLAELVTRDAGPGRVGGGRTTFRCPRHENHHHGDRTPSFVVGVVAGRERWQCFGACQTGGDALDYVLWFHRTPTAADAIRWLRDYTGTTPTPTGPRAATPTKRTTPRPVRPVDTAPDVTGNSPHPEVALRHLHAYLRYRCWPVEVAVEHHLAVMLEHGQLWVRHPFMVPTTAGPVAYGYQDRALPLDREPKWKAPNGWPLPLWGTCSLTTTTYPAVVVCEGPADGISATHALRPYGDIAVVAVPGVSAWRDDYIPLLAGLHVVLALDADNAGQALTKRLRTELAGIAASVGVADPAFMRGDVSDTLRIAGPDGLAAALLGHLDAVGVV